MLNHSLSSLRQIAFGNLSPYLGSTARTDGHAPRSPSSSSALFSPTAHAGYALHDISEDGDRPPRLRRRSTRGNQLSESSMSRGGRLELALSSHQFETFFILQVLGRTLYISEITTGKSPTFKPFLVDDRARSLDISLFARSISSKWRQLLRQKIDLVLLQQVPPKPTIQADSVIMLQFANYAWYTPQASSGSFPSHSTTTLESYSMSQLLRLQGSTDFVNDASKSLSDMRCEMNRLLEESRARMTTRNDVSVVRSRLSEVHLEIKLLRKRNTTDRSRTLRIRDATALRKSLIHSSELQMSSIVSDLEDSWHALDARRPSLELLLSEIRRLQRQLTNALSSIFPIHTNNPTSTIRGLKTAKNSDYSIRNPEEAAALGYIAHFIFILSHYLCIPLRYPVRPLCSHSSIFDPISLLPTVNDQRTSGGPPYSSKQDRRFSLYWEKGQTDRLQWAVYLLNKDIEQLLQARGLVCGDLRHSLQNLEGLVIWLISVNEDEDSSLSQVSRDLQLQPSGSSGMHGQNGVGLAPALEITDVNDLLTVQLRSEMQRIRKGKGRMSSTALSEKDDEDELDHADSVTALD